VQAILERNRQALAALAEAKTTADRTVAELRCLLAAQEFEDASVAAADVLLFLLRHGIAKRRALLAGYLRDLLAEGEGTP
jgi:hypothetical protein